MESLSFTNKNWWLRFVSNYPRRTIEQIREHYEVEKKLATKLKNATYEERKTLYTSIYDELFRRIPYHPQILIKQSSEYSDRATEKQVTFLKRFLQKDNRFLEIGSGDCALSIKLADILDFVYAVDVSTEIVKQESLPPNLQVEISDGTSIPIAANSIDVAYSYQLIEHLHPDDAYLQLKNVYNVLKNGGTYVIITPNKISGPHDISFNFDTTATGLHLREYSIEDLSGLLRTVGFSRLRLFVGGKGLYTNFPLRLAIMYEKYCHIMISKFKKITFLKIIAKPVSTIRLIAQK